MALDLGAIDSDLEPVTLPRGINGQPPRTLPAMDFNKPMRDLAVRVDQGDEAAADALVRRCLPGITDEEVDDLTPREKMLVFGHCGRNLALMVEHLKNVARAEAVAHTTPPSARMTNTSTPSRASGKSRAATGSPSPRSRSTARSTSSIA